MGQGWSSANNVHVHLPRASYAAGETVTGEVVLNVTQPFECQQVLLHVSLWLVHAGGSVDSQGGRSISKFSPGSAVIGRDRRTPLPHLPGATPCLDARAIIEHTGCGH